MGAETAVQAFPALSLDDKRLLLALARETLLAYLSGRGLPDYLVTSAAVLAPRASFVTLRRRDSGDLRGCRGERVARRPLIESVMHMAMASAVDDPRFEPVRVHEVPGLHIEISALTAPQPIRPEDVVVGRHGLIILAGHSAGLLLPQVAVAYGWNREQFLRAVCEKAGLSPDTWRRAWVRLEAFEAEVWGEAEG
ncbi:MAG: AmmeMemoRadiSam system protein A [Gemmatimonadetes bacterium]|nr:AmmeMemoRadiSam system protein A [Gemmatimonadota bacterium]MBI2536728.1 AmmeMemoRadiSam system protein A [Gemmatimonadota bacterium]MBI2616120.1 AmmeMemoRadiSam system protein A [Gemmatimonadota bacterium]